MKVSHTVFAAALPLFMLAGCAAPFSYAGDRCLGSYNQCRTSCTDIPDGPSQAACFDRCSERENICYGVGDDGAGSSLAQDRAIGQARTRSEKEAGFEAYKARKERERIEAVKAGERDADPSAAVTRDD